MLAAKCIDVSKENETSYLFNRSLHYIPNTYDLFSLPEALRPRNRLLFQERVPLRFEEVNARGNR
jgi:hypothetical protein